MKSIERARKALQAGGYITICGNSARFRVPGSEAVPIRHSTAEALVQQDGLEHFADGFRWPFPRLYRTPIQA